MTSQQQLILNMMDRSLPVSVGGALPPLFILAASARHFALADPPKIGESVHFRLLDAELADVLEKYHVRWAREAVTGAWLVEITERGSGNA